MKVLKNLMYAESHEWVEFTEDLAVVGLSDYAQGELGDLVFVNLPEVGDEVVAGEPFGDVESVKAVSDVYAPVTGIVAEVNEVLLDSPEVINDDPYGAWLIKVEAVSDKSNLMDGDAYEAYTKQG